MVCDALDRLSTSWASGRRLCRGLLQLALDLRGFRQANVKVFVRRDQFEDTGLFDFPDASKLRTGAVELDWEHDELYGLLFRGIRAELLEDVWRQQLSPLMPESKDQGGEPYRKAFEHVAGEFMGSDRRRGFTYTWIPKHLADTSHRASPRSFIVAIGKAAESVARNTATPIDYRGIHEGVRAASRTRVDELREDHPWITTVLNDLEKACSALSAGAIHATLARQGNRTAVCAKRAWTTKFPESRSHWKAAHRRRTSRRCSMLWSRCGSSRYARPRTGSTCPTSIALPPTSAVAAVSGLRR